MIGSSGWAGYGVRWILVTSLLGCAGLIWGCAASGPRFREIAVPPDKALVYFYRTRRLLVGAALKHELYVNGEYLGTVTNGSYGLYVAEPGAIEIVTTQSASSLEPLSINPYVEAGRTGAESAGPRRTEGFEVRAGEVYYFEYQPRFGPGFVLVQVPPGVGRKEIEGLRFVDGGRE